MKARCLKGTGTGKTYRVEREEKKGKERTGKLTGGSFQHLVEHV